MRGKAGACFSDNVRAGCLSGGFRNGIAIVAHAAQVELSRFVDVALHLLLDRASDGDAARQVGNVCTVIGALFVFDDNGVVAS